MGLGVSLFDRLGLQSVRAWVTRGQELLEVPTPESSRGGGDLCALLRAPFLQAWATVPMHLESHALGQRPGCPLKVTGETLQLLRQRALVGVKFNCQCLPYYRLKFINVYFKSFKNNEGMMWYHK